MSLTQDHGDIVFECDACHATLETGTSNFEAARNCLRRARWQPKRAGESAEWEHACPECQAGGSQRALPLARQPKGVGECQ